MKDGIYHVKFASTMGAAGEGLVVVKDGSVNGGDAGYLYQGALAPDAAGQLQGQLQVHRWNPGHVSVFGPLGNFALSLTGQAANDSFTVSGGIPDRPGLNITIKGRLLAEAA
jgi:T3SS negative regulator,GrlR